MTIEGSPVTKVQLSEIFPLSGQVVTEVAKHTSEDIKEAQDYIAVAEEVFETENAYAYGYINSLVDGVDGEEMELFLIGAFLAYATFKEMAKGRPLPVLSPEFLDGYFTSREDRLNKLYGSSVGKEAFKEIDMIKGMFAMTEKSAYVALEKEITDRGHSLFEQASYLGFVQAYFLFREGLSDSANWVPPQT